MRKIQSFTNWDKLKKELLKDKKYKEAYERMKPQYELANSLIAIRLKKKLSQQKLAEKVGTRQPVISRLEQMEESPSLYLLTKISKALNVKLRVYFQQ